MKYTFNQQQANISKASAYPNQGPDPKHIDVRRKNIHAPQKLELRNLSKADLNPLYSWKPQKTTTGPIFWFHAGQLPVPGTVLIGGMTRGAQHCAKRTGWLSCPHPLAELWGTRSPLPTMWPLNTNHVCFLQPSWSCKLPTEGEKPLEWGRKLKGSRSRKEVRCFGTEME